MKDRFSKHANQYAQFRPTYPPELFEFIYKHVRHLDTAWDCGTGNGQAARELSKNFSKVFATDVSTRQIEKAYQAENIVYSIANEKSSLDDHSVDLITVAQAAHWFDMQLFSQEVGRVLKPDGIIAIWGYGLLTIKPEVDLLIHHFYEMVIGSYWDKERRHIDEHYANLYFPFNEIQSPSFSIVVSWTLEDLKGYLTTWSAVQRYMMEKGHNPVDALIDDINKHWNEERQIINFPLFLRLGRMHPN
jgi:SAM-dependent methyltransferase